MTKVTIDFGSGVVREYTLANDIEPGEIVSFEIAHPGMAPHQQELAFPSDTPPPGEQNALNMETVLREVMADLSCLDEDPGYNGSRLIIDDSHRDSLWAKLAAVAKAFPSDTPPPGEQNAQDL